VAAVPRGLLTATVRAGVAHAAGALSGAALSPGVQVLLRAATKGVGLTRGKVATAVLAAVLVVAGVGTVPGRLAWPHRAEAAIPDKPQAAASDKLPTAGATRPGPTAPERIANETVTLSGRVLDPDGKPVAGAEITVRWSWATEGATAPRIKATSGADGHFHLRFDRADIGKPPLPPEAEPYQFAPLQVVAAAKGYGPGWINVGRGAKGARLILRLAKDNDPIKGRVRDVQLRPVTDATVHVVTAQADDWLCDPFPGLENGAPTDKEGRFVLTGIGRDRKVRLSVEGPSIERKRIEVSTEKPPAATVEVIARPTKVLEGTVSAEDTGKPLAGVVIRGGPQHGTHTGIYTLTDAQGRYRLVGLPKGESYEVTAWPNRGQTFIPKTATAGDSQGLKPITVDFRLQRGAVLRARMVDKGTGRPVRGILAYDPLGNNLSRPALERNARFGGMLWQFNHFSYPDKDNYCQIVVPYGPGVVFAQGHDIPYLPRPLDPADEKAYPFIKKTPAFEGGLSHYWELFQSYRVFDVKASDKPLELDIEMDPGTTVHGRLVDPDGKPLPGVLAYGLAHSDQKVNNWSYRNDIGYRARVESQTLDTDRFVSAGLTSDGSRPVTFLHAGRKLIANAVVRANHKGPLTVRMEPWGTVTGRIIDPNGKPVPGLTVELLYASQDAPGLLTPGTGGVAPGLLAPGRPFRTDAEGRFRVEGLIPGQKHRLTFPGGVVKDVSTEAGALRDLKDIQLTVTPPGENKKEGANE
jgi:protocatechuate 3,4-dioxygenase beta subunit